MKFITLHPKLCQVDYIAQNFEGNFDRSLVNHQKFPVNFSYKKWQYYGISGNYHEEKLSI